MSFLQHNLCQCKQSVDPSVQISNFIMASALKILTMGFFVSFVTQGEKTHQNSGGLNDEHFDTFPDFVY